MPNILLKSKFVSWNEFQGRVDVIELIVQQMQRKKVQPDPTICNYVFLAYADRGFIVWPWKHRKYMQMICQEGGGLQEKKVEVEDDFIVFDGSVKKTECEDDFILSDKLEIEL